jgi:hypothetical protein
MSYFLNRIKHIINIWVLKPEFFIALNIIFCCFLFTFYYYAYEFYTDPYHYDELNLRIWYFVSFSFEPILFNHVSSLFMFFYVDFFISVFIFYPAFVYSTDVRLYYVISFTCIFSLLIKTLIFIIQMGFTIYYTIIIFIL